jgi:hypothetical protein
MGSDRPPDGRGCTGRSAEKTRANERGDPRLGRISYGQLVFRLRVVNSRQFFSDGDVDCF